MIRLVPFMFLLLTTIIASSGFAEAVSYREPLDNEIFISNAGIEVPLERILLLRKDDSYCAVKFLRYWSEMDEERLKLYERDLAGGPVSKRMAEDASTKKYATYEAHYQGDGSGDFSKKNVIKNEDIASWLPRKGPFRPFIYNPGNPFIKCGPIKLQWNYKMKVAFSPPNKKGADYGFELAPTPWTNISQVNVIDSKIKWYKYDVKIKRIYLPIEKLWTE